MPIARAALVPLLLLAACAASPQYAARAVATPAAAPAAAAPAPLQRSLFARDPGGQLTEEALQKILESPIEIALPARVGVLPILPAADSRGPGPSYQAVPVSLGPFARALRGSEHFTLVTEVLPIPSGALGMEALREIAARYRLRYLILYREDIVRHRRANGWAAGYPTLLGALFLPGQTLLAYGHIEASLFDVKTGLLLFTVRRQVAGQRISNVWHNRDKLESLAAGLAADAAPDLAAEVRAATSRYRDAVLAEASRPPAVERAQHLLPGAEGPEEPGR